MAQGEHCNLTCGTDPDGVPDDCWPSPDCQPNTIEDAKEIANGITTDCNNNCIPDECEPVIDCNNNTVQDSCDILAGTHCDLFGDGVPDECGACCTGPITCETTLEANCPLPPAGSFFPGIPCTPNICISQACCLPTATCTGGPDPPGQACETRADCCVERDCEGDPDPGDCDPTCSLIRKVACEATGGYAPGGAAVECDPNPCGTGSCCYAPAECEDRLDPAGNDCDPTSGAHCMDRDKCEDTGGTYVGGARCSAGACTSPPELAIDAPEPEPNLRGVCQPPGGFGTRNRYLSFIPGNPGRRTGLRVTLTDLPPPFHALNGKIMWVGQPIQICENSAKGIETAPEDCPDAIPTNTFWGAPLQCDVHYQDWPSLLGHCTTLHVYSSRIVPTKLVDPEQPVELHVATYDVQHVYEGCDVESETNFTSPLTIVTSRWGDVCGPGPGGACAVDPDGVVDVVNDVLGLLYKFTNLIPLQKARADIEPGDDGITNGPDLKIKVVNDVFLALLAFQGESYPFGLPDPCE